MCPTLKQLIKQSPSPNQSLNKSSEHSYLVHVCISLPVDSFPTHQALLRLWLRSRPLPPLSALLRVIGGLATLSATLHPAINQSNSQLILNKKLTLQ